MDFFGWMWSALQMGGDVFMRVVAGALMLSLFPVAFNWFLGEGVLHLDERARFKYGGWMEWAGNFWGAAATLFVLIVVVGVVVAAVHAVGL